MSLRRDNEFHSFVVRPATSPAASAPGAPSATGSAEVTAGAGWTLLTITALRWLRAQRPLWWWRVLVGGAALLGVAWLAIVPDKLTALVPFYALAFALLLPVVAVVAWWEREGKYTQLNWDLPLALLGGLAAGAVAAFVLYSGWLKLSLVTWQGALALAAGEEALKTLAVVYFLWSPRARGVREGLRVGAAAALGFTLTQMALASYLVYHATVSATPHAEAALFRAGIASMDHMLAFQLVLQLLGEVVWTATICAAIWRERGERRFHLTPGLVGVLVVVLALHAGFNYAYQNGWVELRLGGAFLPLVNLLLAGVGLALLRFFIVEAREREALGSLPSLSLVPALATYLGERSQRVRHWYAGASAAAASQGEPGARGGQQVTGATAPAPARTSNPQRGAPRAPEPRRTTEPPAPTWPTQPTEPPEPRTPPNTEWLV